MTRVLFLMCAAYYNYNRFPYDELNSMFVFLGISWFCCARCDNVFLINCVKKACKQIIWK